MLPITAVTPVRVVILVRALTCVKIKIKIFLIFKLHQDFKVCFWGLARHPNKNFTLSKKSKSYISSFFCISLFLLTFSALRSLTRLLLGANLKANYIFNVSTIYRHRKSETYDSAIYSSSIIATMTSIVSYYSRFRKITLKFEW